MIDFRQIVVEVLERNVAGLKLAPEKFDMTLRELGVDSLDVMIVMLEIQERTGVVISEDDADRLRSPSDIINFVQASSLG